MAPVELSNSQHVGHETITHMHHIHIGAIPITKPAKQSYVIPTTDHKIFWAEFRKSKLGKTANGSLHHVQNF